ncbi:MAG: BrnT family toxin [Candidatus Levybacteria bacterium]|nr:BrnT family toxin [Candidatus Levybacteria bacterium]
MFIKTLIVEKDRPAHIAKHNITIEEVDQVLSGDYVFIKAREDRWLVIGKTKKGRFLTIVVGERREKDTYGLVTARPTRKEEKSFYSEYTVTLGGETNDE